MAKFSLCPEQGVKTVSVLLWWLPCARFDKLLLFGVKGTVFFFLSGVEGVQF